MIDHELTKKGVVIFFFSMFFPITGTTQKNPWRCCRRRKAPEGSGAAAPQASSAEARSTSAGSPGPWPPDASTKFIMLKKGGNPGWKSLVETWVRGNPGGKATPHPKFWDTPSISDRNLRKLCHKSFCDEAQSACLMTLHNPGWRGCLSAQN